MADKPEEVDSVSRGRSAERRAENLQILVALGILGLAGTLFVQDYITFPLIESVASLNYVVVSFRWFVYATVLFLSLKVITVTLYPFSENRILIIIHDRIEPFLYVASPLFIMLIFVFGWILGRIQSQPVLFFVLGLSLVIAIGVGYWYSSEYRKRQELDRLQSQIVDKLLKTQKLSKNNSVCIDDFLSWFPESQRERVLQTAQEMASEENIPINVQDGKIWISDPSTAHEYIV